MQKVVVYSETSRKPGYQKLQKYRVTNQKNNQIGKQGSKTSNQNCRQIRQGLDRNRVVVRLKSHVNIQTIIRLDRIQEICQNVAKQNKNSEYQINKNKYRQIQNRYITPPPPPPPPPGGASWRLNGWNWVVLVKVSNQVLVQDEPGVQDLSSGP